MKQSDSFYDKIYRAVQQIPPGKVATYGQIASMAGNGNAARVVGNALHVNPAPGVIPCHRVVNAQGMRSAAMKNSSAFSKRREWR